MGSWIRCSGRGRDSDADAVACKYKGRPRVGQKQSIMDPDIPKGCEGIDRIWWYVDRNVCGGNAEKSKCAKYAMAYMIQKPNEKDKLTLDDPRMDERMASFLKAFRDAA